MKTLARLLRRIVTSLTRFCCCAVAMLALLLTATLASADTFFVDDSATGSETGLDWDNAFTDLQDGLAAAEAADPGTHFIRVAQGIYRPGTSPFDTFLINLDNLKVLGGYGGVTEADPDERKIDEFETILSGDLGEEDFSRTIVTISNGVITITEDTLLEGFTITNGEGPRGAGITCTGSAVDDVWPHIRACALTNNTALSGGENFGGGAIKTIDTFGPTTADFLVIRNCTMTGNKATATSGLGGAVFIHADNNPNRTALVHCTLENNQAPGSSGCGGGVHVGTDVSSEVHIVSTAFDGNLAGEGGGAISTKIHGQNTDVFLVNSVVTGNESDEDGGGIYNQGADLTTINSTFSANDAFDDGGAYFENDATVDGTSAVVNSIFWANTAGGDGHEIYNDGDLSIDYCILDGGLSEIGGSAPSGSCAQGQPCEIQDDDPLFCAPGDYELQCTSPAIDAGDELQVPDDEFDVDEDANFGEETPDRNRDFRVLMVDVDLGAYEYQCPDFDGDCSVGLADLLAILDAWGPCSCVEDIDGDGSVGLFELLFVLDAWGPCPCSTGGTDDCADRDLGENCECRDTLTDLIENGTASEEENARCWLQHYIECHDAQGNCAEPPGCPDDDPCGKH